MEKTNARDKRSQRGARSNPLSREFPDGKVPGGVVEVPRRAPWNSRPLIEQSNALWASSNALTFAQCEALVAWRYAYGRWWRRELWSAWQRHDYAGVEDRHSVVLAGLRNHSAFGPNWLARFSFKDGAR